MASLNDPNRDLEVKQKLEQQKKEFKKEESKHSAGWRSKLDKKDWRVRRKNTQGIRVVVTPPGSGADITLHVSRNTTVGDVKKQLKAQSGYFPAQYRLRCGGDFLQHDAATLDELNVAKNAHMVMVLHQGSEGRAYKDGETFTPTDTKEWEEKKKAKKK